MFDFFQITDETIFKKLGPVISVWNGVSYYGVQYEEMLKDKTIQLGFGPIISGYGDWGGGFSHSSSYALKIVIDEFYNIHKVTTDSFYNSKESQKIELKASKIQKKLKDKLIIKNENLRNILKDIFEKLPTKDVLSANFDLTVENSREDIKIILSRIEHYSKYLCIECNTTFFEGDRKHTVFCPKCSHSYYDEFKKEILIND